MNVFGTGGQLVLSGVLRVVGQHRRLVFTHWRQPCLF